MADERPEPVDPPDQPAPAPEEGADPAEAPSIESLQEELAEAKHARQLFEQTLQSLQAARQSPTPTAAPMPAPVYDPIVPGVGMSRAQIDRIKSAGGFASDEEVGAAVRWLRPLMEEMAGPLVGYVAQLADIADRHEARLSVEGYAELAEEIEKEVALQRSRGSHLPRTELAQIAKAKKLPGILAKEAEKKQGEKKAQAAQRRAQGGTDTSIQKVGPSAGGGGVGRVRSIDQAKALPTRDERIKALEELAGNRAG